MAKAVCHPSAKAILFLLSFNFSIQGIYLFRQFFGKMDDSIGAGAAAAFNPDVQGAAAAGVDVDVADETSLILRAVSILQPIFCCTR